MNIFWRELKVARLSLFFWSLGMVVLIGSSIAKFSTYSGEGQSVSELMNQLPQSIQSIFGLTGFNLDSVEGYIGVTFMYVALMAAVHAVLMGSNIISKEERDRTSEFLMSRPVPRSKVIIYKVSAGVVNLLILNAVTLISSIYFAQTMGKTSNANDYIALLMAGLLLMQMIFFLIGATVAAASRRPRLSNTLASSVMLFTFVMTIFINMNHNLEFLKYLTPFKYFDANDILATGSLDYLFVVLSFVLLSIMTVIIFWSYHRRDLSV